MKKIGQAWLLACLFTLVLAGCDGVPETTAPPVESSTASAAPDASETPAPTSDTDASASETDVSASPGAPEQSQQASPSEACFSDVQEYQGTVYETGRYGVADWTVLPVDVQAFTIVDGILYYVTGNQAGDGGEDMCLYRANLDGGEAALLADNVSLSAAPWLSDGKLVYVCNGNNGEAPNRAGIYVLNLTTLETKQLLQGLYYNLLGCDGQFMYYRYYDADAFRLYRLPAGGGAPEVLAIEAGSGALYAAGALYVSMPDASGACSVTRTALEDGAISMSYAFNYDGESLAVLAGWLYYGTGEAVVRTSIDGQSTEVLCPLENPAASGPRNFFLSGEALYFYEESGSDDEGWSVQLFAYSFETGEKAVLSTERVS